MPETMTSRERTKTVLGGVGVGLQSGYATCQGSNARPGHDSRPVVPSGVLAPGTPADVEMAAKEAIEVLGAGGGLILGAGCALPPKTPLENIHALMEATREYGRY